MKKVELLMVECDDLKKYTVKVSYVRQGSGIIFLANKNSEYCYILTAKHNFKDTNKELISREELNLKDIKIEYKKFKSHSFKNILCKDVIYTEHDLAILITLKSDVIKVIEDIDILSILNITKFDNCTFKGYPSISPENSRCLPSNYLEQSDEYVFTIDVSKTLSSFERSEFTNTSGFSGSGILTPFSNDPYLVGLILNVENAFNELICLDLRKIDINSFLQANDYPIIEILNKETIENDENERIDFIKSVRTKLSSEESSQLETLLERKQIHSSSTKKLGMITTKSFSAESVDVEVNETKNLNNEIVKYLESGNVKFAKEMIKDIAIPNGETYRLNSLISLYEKDIDSANKFIESAKEYELNLKDLEFTQGLIYYFSSILDDGYSNLTPYPLDRVFIKNDINSLDNIIKAQSIFRELTQKNDNIDYETWYLASLHLTNLEETKNKAKDFISKSPNHYGAITYITAYDFNINLSNSIKYIENIEDKTLENIFDLFNCYIHIKDYKSVFRLLEENKEKYKDKVLLEKSYINAYMVQALFDNALEIARNSDYSEIKELEKSIIIEKLYSNKQWDELIKIYEEDITPLGLFNLCKIKANLNDWEFIALKVDALISSLNIKSVFSLSITALYNNKEYEKSLLYIDKYNEAFGDLDKKLKRIQSSSLNKIGETSKAISIVESISKKDISDIHSLLYQYNKTGNFSKIEGLAHDLIKDSEIPDDVKISTAHLLKQRNKTLAKKLISNIDINNLSNEQIPSLIPLSLELDNKKYNEALFPKWNNLIEEDQKYGIKFNNIDEFMQFMKEEDKRSVEVFEKYKNNIISFHLLNNSKIYFDKLFNNVNSHIFIRAGNKAEIQIIDENTKYIYLDVSSIFMLFHLNVLDLLIEQYEVYIPPYFIQMINNGMYEYENVCKELVQILNIYIENKKIKFTEELEDNELEEREITNLAFQNLLSLAKTKMKDNSIVLADDRLLSIYRAFDNTPIYGINDLLKTFNRKEFITKDEYFKKILELRRKKLLYIPFENEEFLFHLFNASIEDNNIIETDELKVLREYFIYLYPNLKFLTLQDNDKNKIEAHYIGHLHTFIGRIFFDIWKRDKDNWNVYIDYLVENFLVMNTIYFVKDRVKNYAENHFTALSLSSMLYLSIFHLYEDLEEYIYRINFRFLEPLVYRDKNIFNELVTVLKYNLNQEYKEDKEENKLLQTLHIKFINCLPDKLKNEILKDNKIIKRFNFIQTIKLEDKSINRKELLKKVSLVLNGTSKEILTDEFEIYLEDNTLLVKNILDNNIQTFSDEFYIMSPSIKVQKRVLNNNSDWFDFKESEIVRFQKNILGINEPIGRYLKLESYRDMSGNSYYSSLYSQLKDSNEIDFIELIPNRVEIIASHFRLSKNDDFRTNKKAANKRMLQEKNISVTLERLCSLPQELPNTIITKLNKLSYVKKMELLRSVRNVASTPLNRFHFIRIISKCLDKKISRRIIRIAILKMSKNILLEVRAYLSCYKWVYYKLKYEFELNNELLILLSFGHTDRLFRNFKALSLDLEQLKNEFEQRRRNYLDEILEKKCMNDVLDPFVIDEFNFLFKGLHYALEDNIDYIKNDKFIDIIYSDRKYDIPHFDLLKDKSLLNNCCDSFMNKEYSEFFSHLIGDKKNVFSKNSIEESVSEIFKTLADNPTKYGEYNVLSIIFSDIPIYNQYKNNFIELILRIDFSKMDDTYKLSVLKFASSQNVYFQDDSLEKHIRKTIITLCKSCTLQDKFIQYFDVLIYLSIGNGKTIESKISYLHILLKDLITNENKVIIKDIVNNLMTQLPIEGSNLLIELLLELRK